MSIWRKQDFRSNRVVKKLMPVVHEIEAKRDFYMAMSDDTLKQQTQVLKLRLADKETLDDILPDAFAVVRETSRRVLGLEHYPVQLLGGIVLYQGNIAEMKTGEGKSIVAALPSYLVALKGRGVHVVTVNDYLAARDAEEVGAIHRFLGLSVGCILADMDPLQKKEAYGCDVTYGTNSEFGFDYLRDNMAVKAESCVQGELYYAIVDEVDSILIDEARTPLIISGAGKQDLSLYQRCNLLVRGMQRGTSNADMSKMDILAGTKIEETGDYVVNEKDRQVHLTAAGVKRTEKFFGIENLASPENLNLQHHMNVALRAYGLMHKDKDYVVSDGQVFIVDEFTGRIMKGRRYSDGVHQAIEAKENVEIQNENKTLATITLQNFFNKYKYKCGMTGTAMTERQEFRDIYFMDVVAIPTNKPVIRQDLDDLVYLTKEAKYQAIVEKVKELYKKRQPVLVGTVTIDVSEVLSKRLQQAGIPHQVLNAKFHEKEAEIVSHAGEAGMVTIATNMAGRGTDIKLNEEARKNGGLYIIGTERHESRRIDNQLRGRSGRQGDPGTSQFYISLEDDVLRLFIPQSVQNVFRSMGMEENDVIVHKRLTKAIEGAQRRVEGNHFQVRKSLTEYDAVNNEQRELIYKDRRRVLAGENMADVVQYMRERLVTWVAESWNDKGSLEENLVQLSDRWRYLTGSAWVSSEDVNTRETVRHAVSVKLGELYGAKEAEVGSDMMREAERVVLLKCIDMHWQRHLDDMEQLRQGIGLVGYGQHDPVVEYRSEGFALFDEMLFRIQQDVVRMLLQSKVVVQKIPAKPTGPVPGVIDGGKPKTE